MRIPATVRSWWALGAASPSAAAGLPRRLPQLPPRCGPPSRRRRPVPMTEPQDPAVSLVTVRPSQCSPTAARRRARSTSAFFTAVMATQFPRPSPFEVANRLARKVATSLRAAQPPCGPAVPPLLVGRPPAWAPWITMSPSAATIGRGPAKPSHDQGDDGPPLDGGPDRGEHGSWWRTGQGIAQVVLGEAAHQLHQPVRVAALCAARTGR